MVTQPHSPHSSLRRPTLAIALAISALAPACAHTLNIPRPPPGTPEHPPPLAPSRIELPLTAELGATLQRLDQDVPRTFDTGGEFRMIGPSPVGVRYEVRRSPFRFSSEGGRIVAETTLEVVADACIGVPGGIAIPFLGGHCQPVASCGRNESPRRVVVRTETLVGLSSDWRVTSATRPGEARFLDRCELTAFRIDVSGIAAQAVNEQVATATRQLDERIAGRSDLRARFAPMWASIQDPMDLGEGFWMSLRPERITSTPFELTTDRLSARVGIVARPSVVNGARPTVTATALPELETTTDPAPASNGFSMSFDVEVPFSEVTTMVAQEFRGRVMNVDGHNARVRDLRVRGTDRALLFEIDVTFVDRPFSDTPATIFMVGLPAYDEASGDLVVRNLDYTLETRSGLLRFGEWFLRSSLREGLARRARFPMRARIERLRERAQATLTRDLAPGTRMQGRLGAIRPVGAWVTETGVLVRVETQGEATLTQDINALGIVGH